MREGAREKGTRRTERSVPAGRATPPGKRKKEDPVAAVLDEQVGTIRRLLEAYADGGTDSPDVEDEALTAIHAAIDKIYDIRQERRRSQPRAAGAQEVGYQSIVAWQLKRLRLEANTTQAQLAEAVNRLGFSWSRVTVAEIEAGSRRVSLEELVAIAALFATPLIELLLPAPFHYLRLPNGRIAEPTELLSLVTGIGSDEEEYGFRMWSAALNIAGVRPTEEDWRPAVNRPFESYPHHRVQIVQATMEAHQRTLNYLEARRQAELSSREPEPGSGEDSDSPPEADHASSH